VIITRSPLRITLGGGGTDLPSYYREHSGFLIAAAIDKYVYITLHRTFLEELILKYSKMERVTKVEEIQHPIIREAFRTAMMPLGFEVCSMADIPAGTGLGSSGSFTTALLKALHTYQKHIVHPRELAEEACHIEIDRLREPIGKQDQYIAAFGGVTCFRFLPNDQVEVWPLKIDTDALYSLEESLLLFFTGYSRSASEVLREQDTKSRQSQEALEQGELRRFGELMHVHWEHKKKRSARMSNPQIDEWYNLAMAHGAVGGKLIGAGGGGFLMFYAEDRPRLRTAMRQAGLQEVRFRFDFRGTEVVTQG